MKWSSGTEEDKYQKQQGLHNIYTVHNNNKNNNKNNNNNDYTNWRDSYRKNQPVLDKTLSQISTNAPITVSVWLNRAPCWTWWWSLHRSLLFCVHFLVSQRVIITQPQIYATLMFQHLHCFACKEHIPRCSRVIQHQPQQQQQIQQNINATKEEEIFPNKWKADISADQTAQVSGPLK